MFKKFLFVFIVTSFLAPLVFSQELKVDSATLRKIIDQEVATRVAQAVDDAVAVAVKDVEAKYILIVASKDSRIVELQAEIDKIDNDNLLIITQKANLQINFDNYKQVHGLKRDFTIGGISFASGSLLGVIGGFFLGIKF